MGMPYGQALRLKRICESNQTFNEGLNDLSDCLLKRGFKQSIIEERFRKPKQVDRNTLFVMYGE